MLIFEGAYFHGVLLNACKFSGSTCWWSCGSGGLHNFLVDVECLLEVRINVGYELVCVCQDRWKQGIL